MGIQGAAIATITSQATYFSIWGLSYYLRGKSNLEFKVSTSLKLNSKALVTSIFAIGVCTICNTNSSQL